jgi:hypothetical protein
VRPWDHQESWDATSPINLSDRRTPDYRNSVKESIYAVESLVATLVGIEKGTLGQWIKKLEEEIGLHPALWTAFSSLYGTCQMKTE